MQNFYNYFINTPFRALLRVEKAIYQLETIQNESQVYLDYLSKIKSVDVYLNSKIQRVIQTIQTAKLEFEFSCWFLKTLNLLQQQNFIEIYIYFQNIQEYFRQIFFKNTKNKSQFQELKLILNLKNLIQKWITTSIINSISSDYIYILNLTQQLENAKFEKPRNKKFKLKNNIASRGNIRTVYGLNNIEQIGLVPRSILRTLDRFQKQLFTKIDTLVLQEFRVSRFQVFVSIQCFFSLIFIPLGVNFMTKKLLLTPLIEYFWNIKQNTLFINSYQQHLALQEMQNYEDELYFNFLSSHNPQVIKDFSSNLSQPLSQPIDEGFLVNLKIQKITKLAAEYNQESIESFTNLLGDFVTIITLFFLFKLLAPQIIILKSFLTESIYSLSDTTKSFLLILGTDLLVGFHSPRGWEIFLEFFLDRFGLSHNQNFILLFVATFPVLLDTVFKYWIFRYLNKISPSTVATYHAMI
uniref:envelope membrane protein n=1 Tax=Symbiochloris sp. SG-2018 TaxID=2126034 RepID=UPI0021151ECD|nr:envelope membrane protein [Symbiochloris sp. SG-2018]UTQ75699.1 envelope membrane protein [Symbiochloris sp. SG-2018]